MKFPQYINDVQQTNLNFKNLSKKERLKEYRSYLYIDMIKKLLELERRKLEIINTYNQSVKDIDKEKV